MTAIFKTSWVRLLGAILLLLLLDGAISALMMKGINRYYGLDRSSEILLIGHSHLMLATDKVRMERELGISVSKYCREGVNVSDKRKMVEHFLNAGHADSLKYVLYGVDLFTFTNEGLSENSYKLFYPFMDDENIDAYVRENEATADYLYHKWFRCSRFNDDGIKNGALRGWTKNWDNFKHNQIDVAGYQKAIQSSKELRLRMNERLMGEFQETIALLTQRGIKVILVNTPTIDLLNNYEGEAYDRIINWYKAYADAHPLVEFWDFNPAHSGDYSIFSDKIHLNRKGQQIISGEIITRMKKLQANLLI